MDSEDLYDKKVEKDRKRLYNIIKGDDVDELKKCMGFVRNDLTGEIGTINERLRVGKELMPIEHAIDCNAEECFDYMIGLECLDLTNNRTLINMAVNSHNKHFFNEISERDYTPYYDCTYASVKYPKLDCLRKMIEHPDFKFNNDLQNSQPPMSVFKLLVEMGIDFDKTEALINNVRSWAKSRKTIEYLISVGADINGERAYGTNGTTTPFICICCNTYMSKSLINYFLTRGGDPNSTAKDDNIVERSAFCMYMFKGEYDEKLVNKFIKKGAKYDVDEVKKKTY